MLINVRGTNGSGKTHLVKQFTEGAEQIPLSPTVNGHYNARYSLTIVGPYGATSGGCDRIKTQHEVKEAIRAALVLGDHVIFEGIIVSTIFEPWRVFSQEIGGMVWAYLSTPVDVCIARIYQRNGGKPFDEQMVRRKAETIWRTQEKADGAGERVELLPRTGSVEYLERMLT